MRKANCGIERGQPMKSCFFCRVPTVRIHLPPGESHVRTRRSPTSYVKPRDRVSSRAPGGRSCISPRDSRAERIILTGGQDRSRLHAWDDRHRAKAGLIHARLRMARRKDICLRRFTRRFEMPGQIDCHCCSEPLLAAQAHPYTKRGYRPRSLCRCFARCGPSLEMTRPTPS